MVVTIFQIKYYGTRPSIISLIPVINVHIPNITGVNH